MKTNYLFETLGLILFLSNCLVAQNKCCLSSTVAPVISQVGTGAVIGLNQMTAAPTLAINASPDLPNVEYIITKQGTAALDSQGQPTIGGSAVIIGTDVDGVFVPANQTRYGISLEAGNVMNVMAVGYDLLLMQELTDSLLNGFSSNGQTCCSMFGILSLALPAPTLVGFCDTLNSAGIYAGSDVTDFDDVLTVLSPFIDGQLSAAGLIYIFDLINGNGNYFTQDCGGTGANNFVPYGFRAFGMYSYVIGTVGSSNTCCTPTTIAPEAVTGTYGTLIATNENTPSPVLAVNASVDLPNVEYIITKRNVAALNAQGQVDTTRGGGNVVLGADEDGIFMPMDVTNYGITLAVGDTFDITAIGYDLPAFQVLIDSLLNGVSPGAGPCCGLFNVLAAVVNKPYLAGFCDSVNNAGITGGGDVNNMEELLPVFDVLNNSQSSLASIVATLEFLNSSGTAISSDCGGTGANDFMPYGIHTEKQYTYVVDNPLVVRDLSSISLFMVYPNPVNNGLLNIHLTSKQEVNLSIRLFDALGQEVRFQILDNILGDANTTISTQNLPTGVYYLELADGQSSKVQKVIVE